MKLLINIKTGNKFVWTEELSKAENMAVCDESGRIVVPVDEGQNAGGEPPLTDPVTADEPKGDADADPDPGVLPTIDEFEKAVGAMDLEQLKEKAAELNIDFHPKIGEEKLRERILDEVKTRLETPE